MTLKLNNSAVQNAKSLIKSGKIDFDSDWSEAQPSADQENDFLDEHNWDEYGAWYLGIHTDESEQTKGRFGFPYGDFNNVHRDGVIAAKQRAAQYDYSDIEKAADELLEMIDKHNNDR